MLSTLDINMLILAGAGLQTSAMLFRNQIILRTMFIVGGGCYVTYYVYAMPEPLWEAAAASIAMATSTAIGLIALLVGRSKAIIPKDLIGLYQQMGNIQPGEFRLLLKYGCRRQVHEREALTVQDEALQNLYFIESGEIEAHKNGHVFALPSGIFIGEIAFMTGAPASATIYISAGSEIIEWDSALLRKASKRKDKLRLALDARLAQDLAGKVANAIGSSASGVASES